MVMEWNMLLAVFAGGGVGATLRYVIAGAVQQSTGDIFPFGTLAVNLAGSLLLGLIVQIAEVKAGPGLWMRVFLTVGICGGFTTFSTFSLETFRLLQDGSYLFAAGNIVGSLVLCIIGIWVGMVIGRLL